MKRFILALLVIMLIVSVSGVFADNNSALSAGVEGTNGHDWAQLTRGEQVFYVLGFYTAYSSVIERYYYEHNKKISSEEIEKLKKDFFFDNKIGDTVARINGYYADRSKRDQLLYKVLLLVTDKNYWD